MKVVHAKPPRMPTLTLFLSQPHACGYMPDRMAGTLFADPKAIMNNRLYAFLMERGFRRSGHHVYRHHCTACQACMSVRVPVADFASSRSLRRVWRRNQDLHHRVLPAQATGEQFELYRRYMDGRHHDGPMNNPSLDDFNAFLLAPWSTTRFIEFRKENRLVMVAVVDVLPQALSAVYTFFDPKERARSLGTFAVLWEIYETERENKPHLYLGYWIDRCRKMNYKTRFQPLEACQGQVWTKLHPAAPCQHGGGVSWAPSQCVQGHPSPIPPASTPAST